MKTGECVKILTERLPFLESLTDKTDAEALKMAIDIVNNNERVSVKPRKVTKWTANYYICECENYLGCSDEFCNRCGRRIIWDE